MQSFCFYINTDHQCLRHGGCYIQEAREGPRLLVDWTEGGLNGSAQYVIIVKALGGNTLPVAVTLCRWSSVAA